MPRALGAKPQTMRQQKTKSTPVSSSKPKSQERKGGGVSISLAEDLVGGASTDDYEAIYGSGNTGGGMTESRGTGATESRKSMGMLTALSSSSVKHLERGQKSQGKRIATGTVDARSRSERDAADDVLPPPYMTTNPISPKVYHMIKSKPWEAFYFVIIIMNAIEMGAALHYHEKEEYDDYWLYADCFFAAVFAFEIVMIIISMGHRMFYSFWYTVQTIATIAAVMDAALTFSGMADDYKMTSRGLKSTRLLLMGKLFSLNAETKIIVISMVRSLASLRGVLVVIVVVCYGCTLGVYSVVGLKGKTYDEDGVLFGTSKHEVYFGSLARTMLTLFSVLILSEWDSVARAVYEVQPWFVSFFVAFTVFLTFGLMNVLVGIIVDTVNTIHAEHEERKKLDHQARQKVMVEDVVHLIFGDDNDITLDEFLDITESTNEIAEILNEFHVPYGFTFGDLFSILDDDKDGHMTKDELADGLFSLMAGGDTARFCLLQLHVSKSHTDIVDIKTALTGLGQVQEQMVESLRLYRAESKELSAANLNAGGGARDRVAADAAAIFAQRDVPERPPENSGDLWEQCYTSLRGTVEKHCKLELSRAWEQLKASYEDVYETMEADQKPKGGLLPCLTSGWENLNYQEYYVIRSKMYRAVRSEAGAELRKALDHAIAAGIDTNVLNIELIYSDVLKRAQMIDVPLSKVQNAIDQGDWSGALEMVIETSILSGADKNIIAQIIANASSADPGISSATALSNGRDGSWGLGNSLSPSPLPSFGEGASSLGPSVSPSPLNSGRTGRENSNDRSPDDRAVRAANVRKFPGIRTKNSQENDTNNMQLQLLGMLQTEAYKHSKAEMSRAWEALERTSNEPANNPFSQPEELFFIYNQMCNAVRRKSFSDLQRALNQALVSGVDLRMLEMEIAYRDALVRYYKGTGQMTWYAMDAFNRKDWYLAVDLIVQVCLGRGADRQSLLRALSRITSITVSPPGNGYGAGAFTAV